ncbi:alpha/beta fold hydrolase [Actinopolymorpha sp. B11F2]|uniref:alpha/beta fold hydrolase n=1 Tax=Actinopolymorpha sp. B11F2 TaxID=3160862 RepID=UPI0032E44563
MAVTDRVRRAALVIVLATVTGLVGAQASAAPSARQVARGGTTVTDLMIDVRTGPDRDQRVSLDARLYRPASVTADRPAPAVLLAHGFGGTKESVDGQGRLLAGHGYVVLTWTAQGFGRSGGRIHLNSPDYEVTDARQLLDWLARRKDVRQDAPGDPRVGVVGSSYGGALALLLAGHDRRVDAIVPQATWNDLGRALFPEASGGGPAQGVFKRVWAGWLYAAGFGGRGSLPVLAPVPGDDSLSRPSGLLALAMPADQARAGRAAPDQVPDHSRTPAPAVGGAAVGCGRFAVPVCRMYQRAAVTGRADPATVSLLARSSPASVVERIRAPTLLVQGTQDTLFPLAEADANAVAIRSSRTPVRVMWFSGGHDAGAGSALDQTRLRRLTVRWLDHFLGGTAEHRAGKRPRKSFAFSRITGIDYDDFAVRTLGLYAPAGYPGMDGDAPAREVRLSGEPGQVANPPAGMPAAMSSVPGLGALSGVSLTRVSLDMPGQFVSYDSALLDQPVDVTGAPTVRIRAASSSGTAVLFAKVYDVASTGVTELPGGAVAPVRLHDLPATLDAARPVKVTLPGLVHRFRAGHRIRVTLATSDQAYAGPVEPQTYVAGLAGNSIRLPQVVAQGAERTVMPWLAAAGGLAATLLVAALVTWLLVRRRDRNRPGRFDPDHAETPLVVRGLTKTFAKGQDALRGVDFTVRTGEVVGLLGPNGAGKTTCLRILTGLVRPTAGQVHVFGHLLTPGASVLARVGLLVDGPGFLTHLSGRTNLELFWDATGRPRDEARLDEVLEIAGLGTAIDRRVGEYSHGMSQRLAVAQAMLGMPSLLILDEPTDGLDPPQIAALRQVLRRYAAGGRAVLVSSHLLAEVERTCTHIVVLHRGRRLAAGPVGDVVGDTASVVLDVNDVGRAESLLAGLAVRSVARRNGGLVVDCDGVSRSELVRTLVVGGVGVCGLAPRIRLEDAFLTMVGVDHDGHGQGGNEPDGQGNRTGEPR